MSDHRIGSGIRSRRYNIFQLGIQRNITSAPLQHEPSKVNYHFHFVFKRITIKAKVSHKFPDRDFPIGILAVFEMFPEGIMTIY